MSTAFKNVIPALLLLTFLGLSLRCLLATAEDVVRIHTPDFPEYLSNVTNETTSATDYSEYFQIIKELFDLANSNVSFGELLTNPATREDLNELATLLNKSGDLENARRIEALRDYSSLSPQELLQSINSDELKDLLQRYLESGLLNEEILKELNNMFLSGNISFEDYVKALYFLRETGGGELAMKADALLMSALLNSLADSTLKILSSTNTDLLVSENSDISEALKSMIDFFSRESSASEGLANTLESFLRSMSRPTPSVPAMKFPRFSIDLPALTPSFSLEPLTVFLPLTLVLAGVLVYLITKQRKFAAVLTRLPVIRSHLLEDLNVKSEVIRIYWSSVELLKKRVPMFPNETHREYLDKVLKNISSMGESFKRITEAYEKVRWGAQEEKLFIDNVRRAYEDLMRGIR
ncbi:MAG: DUF4129 domain-containing protein [Zestosphaera sp.]